MELVSRRTGAAPRICVVGEGMVEFVRAGDVAGGWRSGLGGDTLNVAVHLARLGHDVAFLTALGDDPFSAALRAGWAAEGIDTDLVLTDPARQPGLYFVETDARGERSFTYWRQHSAARGMLALPGSDRLLAAASACDVLIYSLITLAILPPEGRVALIEAAGRVRAKGGLVAFDGNYRPRLWPDAGSAGAARDAALANCDIGLPTIEDETLLGLATPDAVARAWQAQGTAETVVKLGAAGCRLSDGMIVPPPVILVPVDTSGAGDAFDAGYLDARLRGLSPPDAATAGHALAGWTVMRQGACPSADRDFPKIT